MVWGMIGQTLESLELVIMARDPEAAKNGFSVRSYLWALEEGLQPVYNG